jgi:hypothetical protein
MEVCIFRDSKYAKIQNRLFIYDGTWGSFRPISKVGWNGAIFVPDDSEFKKDIFSPFYGFGSAEMKSLCESLSDKIEDLVPEKIEDPVLFWRWCGTSDVKWFKDRPCVFIKTCSNLDWKTYLSYLGTKNRTLRHPPRGRMTRRLVRK